MKKQTKTVAERLSSLLMAGVLATSMMAPAMAFAADATPSAGEQVGTGTTEMTMISKIDPNAEYGGTDEKPYLDDEGNPTDEDTGTPNPDYNPADTDGLGSNLKFTVPSKLNFVLAADGTLTGPTAKTGTNGSYIENRSAMPIHASSLQVTEAGGFTIVEDATVNTAGTNSVDLKMTPDGGTEFNLKPFVSDTDKKALDNQDEWNMAATDGVNYSGSDTKAFTVNGHASHVAADITEAEKFGEIHWYMRASEAVNPYTKDSMTALLQGGADGIAELQSAYYAGKIDSTELAKLVSTTFTLPGTDIEAVVVDTENYTIAAEADGADPTAMLTWQTVSTVAYHGMNATNKNAGGWDGSDMRKYLNGLDSYASSGSFLGTLSDGGVALSALLKRVNVVTADNGGSAYTEPKTSVDELFLPAYKEVFGDEPSYVKGESALRQWEYFKTPDNRKKTTVSGGAGSWWERSPRSSNATSFCYVYSDGTAYNDTASYIIGVAPCGCF